jgi:hypothetical protein
MLTPSPWPLWWEATFGSTPAFLDKIVIGPLTGQEGEPLAVRVFAGNTNDPMTVAGQIAALRQQ